MSNEIGTPTLTVYAGGKEITLSSSNTRKFIILSGTFHEGFVAYGPFSSYESAVSYCAFYLNQDVTNNILRLEDVKLPA